MAPGKKITVTVLRDGKEQQVDVTLGNLNQFDQTQQASAGSQQQQQPDNAQHGSLAALGLTLEPNPDGQGVRVSGVADDSPASDKGLQQGDVIVAVGSKAVNSVADVEAGISDAQDRGRDAVLFRVAGRQSGSHFVGVPFERG